MCLHTVDEEVVIGLISPDLHLFHYFLRKYQRHYEMIWTHLICSNFITFKLNTKQLSAQHIPLLGYMSLPSPWELLVGFTEPIFEGVMRYYSSNRLCSFLATAEAPYPVEHSAACRSFLSTNCRQLALNIWRCNIFFTQEPRGPSLPW
jgi:hypothetical protein